MLLNDETKALLFRKTRLAGILEQVCQRLELTDTQRKLAEDRYLAVGSWLQRGDYPALELATVYPQGSVALGTTVKPIGQDEFDLDLVCLLGKLRRDLPADKVMELIGRRLAENGHYIKILLPKNRCWRLDYAGNFHLDITPSIPNRTCSQGGELVPDKNARDWKATNPKGYRDWFENKAKLQPTSMLELRSLKEFRAAVEELPPPSYTRGVLRRSVQLCKRHRDIHFLNDSTGVAPISIIITTLAAKSYERCVMSSQYATDLDLLLDVVRGMLDFIDRRVIDGKTQYAVWNETTEGENFAEKWNESPERAEAFFSWHRAACTELANLEELVGIHEVRGALSRSFGEKPVGGVFDEVMRGTSEARENRVLRVAPVVGVTTSGIGAKVPRHTFFGR